MVSLFIMDNSLLLLRCCNNLAINQLCCVCRRTGTLIDITGCWSCWWKILCVTRHPSLSVGGYWSNHTILLGFFFVHCVPSVAHQLLCPVAGDCTHCKVLWTSRSGVSQSYSTGCSVIWNHSWHIHFRMFEKGWEGLYSTYNSWHTASHFILVISWRLWQQSLGKDTNKSNSRNEALKGSHCWYKSLWCFLSFNDLFLVHSQWEVGKNVTIASPYLCPPCPHVTAQEPRYKFSWNLIFWSFTTIYESSSVSVKIWQE